MELFPHGVLNGEMDVFIRMDGNALETAKYCLFPLLAYHSRWNEINKGDIFPEASGQALSNRGFAPNDTINPVSIAYTGPESGEECETPYKTDKAITQLLDLCQEHGITLVFFKAPVSTWTRNESKTVKAYMQERGLTYLELNDYLEEIGIDPDTDFLNAEHLNTFGANKTTDFIAQYLMDNYQLGKPAAQ